MMDLQEDIAEMFSALAGRDRYTEALERFCARALDRRREYDRDRRQEYSHTVYQREYQLRRYRTEPDFRARHREAVDRYKDRLLGADRKRRVYGPLPVSHGTYNAYTKRGCRCADCRAASAAYQRQRRATQKEHSPVQVLLLEVA